MVALDTNILVYAHRHDSHFFGHIEPKLEALAESGDPWGIPIPCLHEFIAVVTNQRLWPRPSTLDEAITQIDAWLEAPSVQLLNYTRGHVATLFDLCRAGKIFGGMIHDARIASICIENGVRELWTLDRDFSRFKALKTRNPLVS